MNSTHLHRISAASSRRDFLRRSAFGFGVSAISSLMSRDASALSGIHDADTRLFPAGQADSQWSTFTASGYQQPVTGIVYRDKVQPLSGVPMGALATGCIDVESSGLWGYSSIFNHLTPRGGPVNEPILGLAVGDRVWALTTGQTKSYDHGAGLQPPPGPKMTIPGVTMVKRIDYWGHYPVLDMEFETDAPVSVGMRSWSPFLPGDSATSNTPVAYFDVYLRNVTKETQQGCIVFNFPGLNQHRSKVDPAFVASNYRASVPLDKLPEEKVGRYHLTTFPHGPYVFDANWNMGYMIATPDEPVYRTGRDLSFDPQIWKKIRTELPTHYENQKGYPGSSVAVDFTLAPGATKTVRYLLAWYAPVWKGSGSPDAGGNDYKQMYARRFPDAVDTARWAAVHRENFYSRVLAWQSEIYNDRKTPGWLADSLINNLAMIPRDSVWAQAGAPIGPWADPEMGLFAWNESPRSCPHIETLPNSAIGNVPLVYFFPECVRTTLEGFKAYQWKSTGAVPILWNRKDRQTGENQISGHYDLVSPWRGYQTVMMGANYMIMLDRFWKVTRDRKFLDDFYESAKLATEHTLSARPDYADTQVVAMPLPGTDSPIWFPKDTEWFEAPSPDWMGYVTHAGGVRLASLKMMRTWAEQREDAPFVAKLDVSLKAGQESLESKLWNGRYYSVFYEPTTNNRFDAFFTSQLDGQYFAWAHGEGQVFPKERINTILTYISDKACKLSQFGVPPNYVGADGGFEPTASIATGGYGKYAYFNYAVFYDAMNFMYAGQKEFGLDLLRRPLEVSNCRWGYTWDGPHSCGGDADTGQRTYGTDYYMNCAIWGAPAAIAGEDISGPAKPGGLVDRVLKAAMVNNGKIK